MKSPTASIFILLIANTITSTLAVAGGNVATAGQFPYQVSIRNADFGHICGGVIVSKNLVITAAACTDPRSPKIDLFVAGSLKRTANVLWQQERTVRRTVIHPGYDGSTLDNDLTLLFLNDSFEFNDNVSSVALPSIDVETFPKSVILSGWGNVQYNEPLFEDLQYVELQTYSDVDCEEIVGQYVRPEILCVGWNEGGRGGCQGDAGSGLVTQGNDIYVSSIESHFPCPRPDYFRLRQCTELTYYVDWILEQSELYGGGLSSGVEATSIMKYFYLVSGLLFSFVLTIFK